MTRALAAVALVVVMLAPARAAAHAADLGRPPEVLLRTFTADPFVLVPGAIALALLARGARIMRRRGRWDAALRRRAAALVAAIVLACAAICSPLDALGSALFSAHMTQHLVLVALVAPAAAYARPARFFAWAMPRALRLASARVLRRAPALTGGARALGHPLVAFALHAAALWAWHLPALYEAALLDDRVHALEHSTMTVSAWLYWRALIGAGGQRGIGHAAAVLFAFGGALQGTVLGALMTLARAPWYRAHAGGPESFGATLLGDQQLAGLLMWVPGGLVYLAAGLASFAACLRAAREAASATDAWLEAALGEDAAKTSR